MENSFFSTEWLTVKTKQIASKIDNEKLNAEDFIFLILKEIKSDIEKLEKKIDSK